MPVGSVQSSLVFAVAFLSEPNLGRKKRAALRLTLTDPGSTSLGQAVATARPSLILGPQAQVHRQRQSQTTGFALMSATPASIQDAFPLHPNTHKMYPDCVLWRDS